MTADGVEVTGFPDLARKYQVSSVPKTVVEEGPRRFEFSADPAATAPGSPELFSAPSGRRFEFVGAGPESMLLKHVQEAAGSGGLVV